MSVHVQGTRRRRHPLAVVMLALSLITPCNGGAATEPPAAAPPGAVVRATVDAVIAVLGDRAMNDATKRRQVRSIIGEHFDYAAMSSRVLATNWSKADADQRRRFTALFRQLLSNTYWRKISGYSNETVDYTGEHLRAQKLATVNTVIRTDT
ncbi:MAG: ABC transporter substrate-binding protein, partial [Gammaproteobacteria bacterium]